MPWRLIIMILVVAVFLVFITFNLENKCEINFFGARIPDVPIFVTIFISFVFGLLCSIPLVVLIMRKQKRNTLKETNAQANDNQAESSYAEPVPEDKIKKDAREAKKRFFLNRQGKKK
ncbi:MAG: hypothetical protein FWC21_03105 [Treponema sp.]|nr:hypothetical protein [Treponema sp.]